MTDQPHRQDAQALPQAGILGRMIMKCGNIFAVAIVLSAAILIYEVVLRYVFNAPTIWAHETVIFLTAMTFIFGGLYATASNKHIRVVLIYDMLPPAVLRWVNIIISVASAIASALFAWAGWLVVKRAIWTPAGDFRLETSGSAWNPPTPGLLKLSLFVALILLSIQFTVLAFNYWKRK